MEKVDPRITKARAQLILDQPFYGALCMRLPMIEDETVGTFCTDGKEIRYSPAFLDKLKPREIQAVIAHEVLHCVFLHQCRRGDRNAKQWNYAADYAINPMLKEAGFTLPDGALIDPAYQDKGAEEIYGMIPEPPKDSGNSFGEVKDAGNNAGQNATAKEEQAQQEQDWKIATIQAAHQAKNAGKCPASIARMVEDLVNPKIPWADLFRHLVTEKFKDDYTWKRPNRRFIAQGLYLPSIDGEQLPHIAIAIDTSGSIDNHRLTEFASEVNGLCQELQLAKVTVIYCDYKIAGVDTFEHGETIEFKPVGGGGTAFEPVFDHVEEMDDHPKMLIYFTDMYGSFPQSSDIPTVWLDWENSGIQAPFGETVVMN